MLLEKRIVYMLLKILTDRLCPNSRCILPNDDLRLNGIDIKFEGREITFTFMLKSFHQELGDLRLQIIFQLDAKLFRISILWVDTHPVEFHMARSVG